MIVTDGVGGLIQVFNLRFPSNLRRKIQFPFSYDYFRSQQVSGEEENVEQIGPRICFNSWQCQSGAKVQGSRLIHTCRAGARSCQLASNLCIQRHLNAVAVGGEEQEEPAQMVHCQSGSQSVTHSLCPSLSQFVLLAILAYFHFSQDQSVPFVQEGQREREGECDVMGAKSQRDTRHFMRLWGIV